MKKAKKPQKTPLRISSETVRTLSLSQLTEVAGGSFKQWMPRFRAAVPRFCQMCAF